MLRPDPILWWRHLHSCYADRHMVNIRKITIILLCGITLAVLVTAGGMELYYSGYLPPMPDVQKGRIYRMVVQHGFIVYGTKQEFQRLRIVRDYFLLVAIICGGTAGVLNVIYGDFPASVSMNRRKP